jgi:pimeloyl-ACP methyl ester carboxylesterase
MFRKSSLLIAVFLLYAGLSPTPAEAELPAPAITDKPTIVIVHGAWGGSWAFKEVESLLREKGYNVYRPSLTGQGERVHLASPEINLSTHIEDVVNVFLFEELDDVVLVGHSYGGMVITGVADRLYDRIRCMIYLDAFVPHDGESLFSIQGEGASGIRQMERNGFLIPPWVQADQPPPVGASLFAGSVTRRMAALVRKALELGKHGRHAIFMRLSRDCQSHKQT